MKISSKTELETNQMIIDMGYQLMGIGVAVSFAVVAAIVLSHFAPPQLGW